MSVHAVVWVTTGSSSSTSAAGLRELLDAQAGPKDSGDALGAEGARSRGGARPTNISRFAAGPLRRWGCGANPGAGCR